MLQILSTVHRVHVHREQGPEQLAVLHQQVREPREGLQREYNLSEDIQTLWGDDAENDK